MFLLLYFLPPKYNWVFRQIIFCHREQEAFRLNFYGFPPLKGHTGLCSNEQNSARFRLSNAHRRTLIHSVRRIKFSAMIAHRKRVFGTLIRLLFVETFLLQAHCSLNCNVFFRERIISCNRYFYCSKA